MDDAIRAFMTFLELERHASHETVRNYASDLRQFQTFMTKESPSARVFDPCHGAYGIHSGLPSLVELQA